MTGTAGKTDGASATVGAPKQASPNADAGNRWFARVLFVLVLSCFGFAAWVWSQLLWGLR